MVVRSRIERTGARKRPLILSTVCLLLLGIYSPTQPEKDARQQYTIRAIEMPTHEPIGIPNVIEPVAVNSRGQVIGYSYFRGHGLSAAANAWLWQAGKARALPALGGEYTHARAINENGDIVGDAETEDRRLLPVLWPADQMEKPLRLSAQAGCATGINGKGDVVISSEHGTSLWRPDGPPTPLLDKESRAVGINDFEDVALYSIGGYEMFTYAERDAHAFLWREGKLDALKTPFGKDSVCTAINAEGLIVGYVKTAANDRRACLWKKDVPTILDTLGGVRGEALAINSQGDIVGWTENARGDKRACLWRDSKAIDLNTLLPPDSGWEIYSATGINDQGQIIGDGTLKESSHPFLLSPSPQKHDWSDCVFTSDLVRPEGRLAT